MPAPRPPRRSKDFCSLSPCGQGNRICPIRSHIVMAGLDPAIHGVRLPPHSEPVFRSSSTFRWDGEDGRVKPGHDGNVMISANAIVLPCGRGPECVSRPIRFGFKLNDRHRGCGLTWPGQARSSRFLRLIRYFRHDGLDPGIPARATVSGARRASAPVCRHFFALKTASVTDQYSPVPAAAGRGRRPACAIRPGSPVSAPAPSPRATPRRCFRRNRCCLP